MSPSHLAACATILVLLSTCGFSQQAARKSSILAASEPAKKTTPKLTAKQRHAFELLQTAVAEAAGLEPDMRSFVLWHAALGVEAFDKKKGSNLLRDAFLASQSVEEKQTDSEDCGMEEVCHVRRFLQGSILREIAIRSPVEAERLAPQAEPDVQQLIVSFLIDHYTHKKNFERAKALLATSAGLEPYPYSEATNLMLALPTASPDRFSIFIASFQQLPGARL